MQSKDIKPVIPDEIIESISNLHGDLSEKTDVPNDTQLQSTESDIQLSKNNTSGISRGQQYEIRDALYTDLLDNYIRVHDSKYKWNKWYKLAFFVVTMLAFATMIAAPMIALVIIAHRGNVEMNDVALVASGVVGIVSAIIVLPKIIAEHLFPKDENAYMINMVQNMQKNDSQIRNFIRSRRPIPTDQDNANGNQNTFKIKNKQKQKPKSKQNQ